MAVTRGSRETVLYYSPAGNKNATKLKGVLVQMGIRIRNVSEDQLGETIGALLGLEGFKEEEHAKENIDVAETIDQEVLVMHNFSGSRLDELLLGMRRAKVQKIDLKAIVTENNVGWSFYHLYEEIGAEHERMHQNAEQ